MSLFTAKNGWADWAFDLRYVGEVLSIEDYSLGLDGVLPNDLDFCDVSIQRFASPDDGFFSIDCGYESDKQDIADPWTFRTFISSDNSSYDGGATVVHKSSIRIIEKKVGGDLFSLEEEQ